MVRLINDRNCGVGCAGEPARSEKFCISDEHWIEYNKNSCLLI